VSHDPVLVREKGAADSDRCMHLFQSLPSALRRILRCVATFVVCCIATSAAFAAETYKTGDTFEAFSTKDAKDHDYAYEPGALRSLIVSYTMSNGKAVNGYLAAQATDFLDSHQAAFLADIHGMPAVGRFFAMPKMARYPHRILLGDADGLLARHPQVSDRITVFTFDAKGAITAIRHLDPETELGQLFPGPANTTEP
jgi:hypothetical protein